MHCCSLTHDSSFSVSPAIPQLYESANELLEHFNSPLTVTFDHRPLANTTKMADKSVLCLPLNRTTD